MAGYINATLSGDEGMTARLNAADSFGASLGNVIKLGSIDVYPVGTELTSGWLSLTDGGEALTPRDTEYYVLVEASEHYAVGTRFRWNGTRYVAVLDGDATVDDTLSQAGMPADAKAVGDNFAPAYSNLSVYAVGDIVLYEGRLYKCVSEIAVPEAWVSAHWERVTFASVEEYVNNIVSSLESDMDEFKESIDPDTIARIDGAYESMTVGSADQLISTVYIEDATPYLFRTSGGSADIGDREIDEIVGGSLVWIQLVQNIPSKETNGVTYTFADGVLSVSGTSTGVVYLCTSASPKTPFIENHKYYVALNCNGEYLHASASETGLWYIPFTPRINLMSDKKIVNATATTEDLYLQHTFNSGVTVRSDLTFKPQLFDLTAMFGPTIADYIYQLEQTTEGAGIAKLKSWGYFTKDYYPYDPGTMRHVEGLSAHNMVGFNQWDEEWEVGIYNKTTGEKASGTTTIRSKNKIRVLPSTSYYIKVPYSIPNSSIYLLWYDANETFITFKRNWTSSFTTPSNACYMTFELAPTYGTTYNHDICIHLHWDGERDGEYEEYVKHSYPLDSSLVLRGIPKQDANGNLHYDGDRYKSDGTVERRYAEVDLGTLNWSYITSGTNPYFKASTPTQLPLANTLNIRCKKYTPQTGASVSANDKSIGVNANSFYFYVADSDYTDAASFKAAMSGVMAIYELATPTTETAQPYTNPQNVDDWGTEEYITTGIIPVGHETRYTNNLRAKLEMAPDSPSGDGDYIVRQTDGENTYVPLIIPSELPGVPTTDGTYVLKVTVSNNTHTYTWESEGGE